VSELDKIHNVVTDYRCRSVFFEAIHLVFSVNEKLKLNSLAQTACDLIKKLKNH